jgi:hypothetical protein
VAGLLQNIRVDQSIVPKAQRCHRQETLGGSLACP